MDQSAGAPGGAVASGAGCLECEQSGGWWVHLRRCVECGHVGCCDSSPSQHARTHTASTGHRVVGSFEPLEEWFWDYASQSYLDPPFPIVPDPQHHPLSQSVPGPSDRVPSDWPRFIH